MTPIQACQETQKLWIKLAESSVEHEKLLRKEAIPGPWKHYRFCCPCCEYVCEKSKIIGEEGICSDCPMRVEWSFYSDVASIPPCEEKRSPYRVWSELDFNAPCIDALCIDVEFFCLLIADLAKEAEMRLRKDHKMMEILLLPNGNTAVFEDNKPVPKLQESWLVIFAKSLKDKEINIEEVIFLLPNGETVRMTNDYISKTI